MNPQVLSAPGRPRLMHDVVPPYASILAKTKTQPIEPAPQMEAQAVEQAPAVPEAPMRAVEAAPVVEATTEMPVEPTAHPAFVNTPAAPLEAVQAEIIAPAPIVKAASSKSHVVAITIALLVSAALLAAAYYAFSQRGL